MITRNKLVVAAVMTAAATLLSAGGAEARSHVDVGDPVRLWRSGLQRALLCTPTGLR
jgi:hypothetical protein